MALTGLDPNRRTPGIAREFLFAQGVSSGSGTSRSVLLMGNKTSAGSETVDTINEPVADNSDAEARMGRRSELYGMYRKYVAVDPNATIYFVACAEHGSGTAATRPIVYANAATGASTGHVYILGEDVTFSIAAGDSADDIGAAAAAAINNYDAGGLPVTAANSSGTVTLTTANLGVRQGLILDQLRATIDDSIATTATVGSLTAGTNEDDHTNAIALAAEAGHYYIVSPKHQTTGPTATDNGTGELLAALSVAHLPAGGKEMQAFFGLVGTPAEAVTVATDSDVNNVLAQFAHSENSDWTPALLAAHYAAVVRSQQIAHPSANLTDYSNDPATGKIFQIPAPYSKGDWPTPTEIETMLAGGVTPIGVRPGGRTYIVRQVTSRSQNAAGQNDYRASEGHIPSAIHFAWDLLKLRYTETKQPFVSDDLAEGEKPLKGVTTPSAMRLLTFSVIEDLASGNPLGVYEGPILAPDQVDAMKASVSTQKVGGGIAVACDFIAVEHNNKAEFKIRETGSAY